MIAPPLTTITPPQTAQPAGATHAMHHPVTATASGASLTVWPNQNLPVGQPVQLTLNLTNSQTGQRLSQFDIVHTQPVHFFLIRDDLAVFRHEHPTLQPDGQWQLQTNLPDAGQYHVFAQYKPTGQEQQTSRAMVSTGALPQRIAPSAQADDHLPKFIGPYEFRISGLPNRYQPESHYQVQVLQNGQPVQIIQPYLGVGGHSVIASMGAKELYHVHHMSDENQGQYASPLTFHTKASGTGLHKVWTQIKINDQVYTVDWTFNV